MLLLLLLLLGCCLGAVVEQRPDGSIGISVLNKDSGRVEEVVVDALLVATGRRPNVSGMGLDQAGVKFNSCVTSPSSLWASLPAPPGDDCPHSSASSALPPAAGRTA